MLKNEIQFIEIDESSVDQRIDNYLFKVFKSVPKTHIYKIIRSGEVRVNKKRIKSLYKLKIQDVVRIPPLSFTEKTIKQPSRKLNPKILYEDEWFIVVDKPSGLAVHGGSGIDFGLIEYLRNDRPDSKFLELVHRLDKNTSGILLIAKKRSALRSLQELFRLKKIKKNYFVGVHGIWTKKRTEINSILQKINTKDGHHVNVVNDLNIGKLSKSVFYLIKCVENFSLLSVHLITGRTHQIRVQLAHEGFPVLGDDKYGDFNLNKELKRVGLKRMFLHAHKISFQHPFTEDQFECESELPQDLSLIFNE